MTKPLLIVYGLSKDQQNALEEITKGTIDILEPTPDVIHQRVGYLAGLSGYEREELPAKNFPKDIDFLLFCFTPQKNLYEVLTGLNERGYTFPYKAALTETTKDWQFSFLLEHIVEEHKLVQAYNHLGVLVKKAEEYIVEHPNVEIEKNIQQAKALPKIYGEELTIEIIQDLYKILEQQLND